MWFDKEIDLINDLFRSEMLSLYIIWKNINFVIECDLINKLTLHMIQMKTFYICADYECETKWTFITYFLQAGSCRIYVICVCLRISVPNTNYVVFLCYFSTYPMLPVSLDCPLLVAPSEISNVYYLFPTKINRNEEAVNKR